MIDLELIRQTLFALECNLPVIEDYGDKEQLHIQHKAINALRGKLERVHLTYKNTLEQTNAKVN